MVRTLVLASLLLVAIILLALAIIGLSGAVELASADGLENPANTHSVIYGSSIVAENHYVLVNAYGTPGNYDISYDGDTCFRWISSSRPVVVSNPQIITYTTPVDDFDLVHIIACES